MKANQASIEAATKIVDMLLGSVFREEFPDTAKETIDRVANIIESENPDTGRDDAKRYRRLRILGCAVFGHPNLDAGRVSRFTNLDAIIDEDIKAQPSRGEHITLS